jgi:biopolymer transport protein ExbD
VNPLLAVQDDLIHEITPSCTKRKPQPGGTIPQAAMSNSLRKESPIMTTANRAERTLVVPVTHARPNINVTPLIDVLLVLLIIFMVVSPLKPSRFLAKVASKPDEIQRDLQPPIDALVVTIKSDSTLMLNGLTDMGSVNDTSRLAATLSDLFQKRLENHAYRYEMRDRVDLPEVDRVQKTVFIKAPRAMPYAEVVRVLDSIKGAGASPIGLQIDDLN